MNKRTGQFRIRAEQTMHANNDNNNDNNYNDDNHYLLLIVMVVMAYAVYSCICNVVHYAISTIST